MSMNRPANKHKIQKFVRTFLLIFREARKQGSIGIQLAIVSVK
jgi:hypothetical protein